MFLSLCTLRVRMHFDHEPQFSISSNPLIIPVRSRLDRAAGPPGSKVRKDVSYRIRDSAMLLNTHESGQIAGPQRTNLAIDSNTWVYMYVRGNCGSLCASVRTDESPMECMVRDIDARADAVVVI